MRSFSIFFIFSVFAAGFFFVKMPMPAFADSGLVPCGYQQDVELTGAPAEDCTFNSFITLVQNVMDFLLFTIAMPLAALSFAYAGWLYMSAAGNESNVKQAHEIFKNVIIGLSIALAAWLIVNTILSGLGVSSQFNFLAGS